jgi:pseudouridine synthase family
MSRRKADLLIEEGRVRVNGLPTTDFSLLVDIEKDEIEIDGELVSAHSFDYVVMHKPKSIVTTCDDEKGAKLSSISCLAVCGISKPVGRLDSDSEGLLILTNDGNLTKTLTHPSHEIAKIYVVTVKGQMKPEHFQALSRGIQLSEGVTRAAKVRKISANSQNSIFEIAIKEGRNRQIRRMCTKLGFDVQRLVRVAIGGLQLGQLPPGKWRRLTDIEISLLYRA